MNSDVGINQKKQQTPKESRQFVSKGVLEAIVEIGSSYREENNGVFGPGYSSWKIKTGEYTILSIASGEERTKITYTGIILPDSIGHDVEIFKEIKYEQGLRCVTDNTQILDLTIKRWYL
jgi:hypothetical protein